MSEKVLAAIDFLNDFASNSRKRSEAIESLGKKLNTLKPAVEEYKRIKSKIEFLRLMDKEDKDFLLNMKSMLEKNYPVVINIDDPTLFDQSSTAQTGDTNNEKD